MVDLLSDRIETPIGPLVLLVRDGAIVCLEFADQPQRIARELEPRFGACRLLERDDPCGFSACIRAYFAGELAAIDDVPADGGGTAFQRRVWKELRRIPRGNTITYRALARRMGDPAATRAVGAANGRNPISIVVPCHRVIGSDGSLTGYGGGLGRKSWLLEHERTVTAGIAATTELASGACRAGRS